MAKQGMARPDWTKRPKNTAPPVPELQGRAKTGKEKAKPIIAGTSGPDLKVYHAPSGYTDLARDNLANDLPAADLEDL
jgi:hypothetical protein